MSMAQTKINIQSTVDNENDESNPVIGYLRFNIAKSKINIIVSNFKPCLNVYINPSNKIKVSI